MQSYPCPTCPVDCSTVDMPEVSFAVCAEAIALNFSEIEEIYIVEVDSADETQPVAKPTDWSLPADWATVLDQSVADKIRKLTVIGDLAEVEKTEVTLPKGLKKTTKRTFTLNADIMDMNDTNYEMLRTLECGGTYFIWFVTKGGFMYGGPSGVKVNVDPDLPLARGEESYEIGKLVFDWEGKCHPPRQVNPL